MLKYYILFLILSCQAFSHIFSYDSLKPEYLIEISSDEKANFKDNFIHEEIVFNDERYLCLIPLISSNESSIFNLIHSPESDRNKKSEQIETSDDKLRISEHDFIDAKKKAVNYLKPLSNQCLFHKWGWWTCSFCYGKSILQFHHSESGSSVPKPDEGSIVYTLGDFESLKKNSRYKEKQSKSSDPIDLENAILNNKKDVRIETTGKVPYLVYFLKQGTLCELTGSERTIEVQFYCSEDSKSDSIAWIKELRSCHYQMAIYTSRLCEIPLFVPSKKSDPNKIICKKLFSHQAEFITLPININRESKKLDDGLFYPSKKVKFIASINSIDFFQTLENFDNTITFYSSIFSFIQNKLILNNHLSYSEYIQLYIQIAKQIGIDTDKELKNNADLSKLTNHHQKILSFEANQENASIILLISTLINLRNSHQLLSGEFQYSKMYSLGSIDDRIYISIKKDSDIFSVYLLNNKIDSEFLEAFVEYLSIN